MRVVNGWRIFAWVNDADTLRVYGSRSDAYAVFRSMLDKERPPDDWRALLIEADNPHASKRSRDIGEP